MGRSATLLKLLAKTYINRISAPAHTTKIVMHWFLFCLLKSQDSLLSFVQEWIENQHYLFQLACLCQLAANLAPIGTIGTLCFHGVLVLCKYFLNNKSLR